MSYIESFFGSTGKVVLEIFMMVLMALGFARIFYIEHIKKKGGSDD